MSKFPAFHSIRLTCGAEICLSRTSQPIMMHHDESESTKDTSGKVSGYGTKQYWDKRYSKPDSSDSQHEWYFTYQELEPILEPCLTTLFESRWVDDVKYGVVE